jgi:hypothetical protein
VHGRLRRIPAGRYQVDGRNADSADGKFHIAGLDAGTYEITAWHERLGTQTASVRVGANETTSQNFTFAVPTR